MAFEHRVHEHGADDDAADHDLLEKRRHAQQVQAVAQHAHDKRADQRTRQRAFAAHQAGAADDGGGNGVELVHHPGNRLRRVEPRGQDDRRDRAHQARHGVDQRLVQPHAARPTAASPLRCRRSRRHSGRRSCA